MLFQNHAVEQEWSSTALTKTLPSSSVEPICIAYSSYWWFKTPRRKLASSQDAQTIPINMKGLIQTEK